MPSVDTELQMPAMFPGSELDHESSIMNVDGVQSRENLQSLGQYNNIPFGAVQVMVRFRM
jgi:hypothetical protein